MVRRSQIAVVVGRPTRGTDEGRRHHDGDGQRGQAHGAGDIVVLMTGHLLVLCTEHFRSPVRVGRHVIILWTTGQAQGIGSTTSEPVERSARIPCVG